MDNIKLFKTDCHTVVDRSDVNLKGLHYEIVTEVHSGGFKQKLLYIRETKATMKERLSEYLFEWAYDGHDFIGFCEEDFEASEFNPFVSEPLVTESGTITTDEPLFMCVWNGDDYQIHTQATLWQNFKDTNLFDVEEDGWCVGANFPMLMERLHLELDFTVYHNDNMSIRRIK
tara:strand:- start:401 stop:919 length:519 start_codon:yes stop_codon:yes gene_type:complete